MKKVSILSMILKVLLAFGIVASLTAAAWSEEVKDYNNEPVTITVACFPALDAAYSNLIPLFNKRYPFIKVDLQVLGYTEHHNKLTTTMAAGEGVPDVATVEVAYLGTLGGGGGFINLLEKPFNAGKYKEFFAPYMWAQASTSDKELIALPVDMGPGCAYYRTDVLGEVGVKIEDIKTMDDLFALGKKVRKVDAKGKATRWLIANTRDIVEMYIRGDNIWYFDKNGVPALDRPQIRAGLTFAKRIRDAGYDAKIGSWTPEWYGALKDGAVAFQPSGAWLTGHLKNWMAPTAAGKWKVAKFPALKKGGKPLSVSWGGSFLAIPTTAKYKGAAWKFIEFATTRVESQLMNYEKADAFPSLKAAWTNKIMSDPIEYLGGQKARLLWADIASSIPEVYVNEKDAVAASVLTTAVGKVLDEGKDIDKSIKEAQKTLENRVKRSRRN
jgi:multiple sugar transport system substrate-binding protein